MEKKVLLFHHARKGCVVPVYKVIVRFISLYQARPLIIHALMTGPGVSMVLPGTR